MKKPIPDPYELWKGMPEFKQEDQTSYKKLIVHFACEDDYKAFQDLIGQKLTNKTRSIWFPYLAPEPFMKNRCIDES